MQRTDDRGGVDGRDDNLGTVSSPEMLSSRVEAAALIAETKNSLVGKPRS